MLSYFFQVFRVILFLSGFSRYLISFRFFALSYFLQVFRVVLFPSSFSFKSLYIFLFSPMPATYAAYPTIPDVIILIMRDEIIFIFVSAVTKIRLELFVYVPPPPCFKITLKKAYNLQRLLLVIHRIIVIWHIFK